MPGPKEFTVSLGAGDRAKLTKVVSSGRHPARMITRARVLLALDETQGPAPDRRVVAERVGTSESTVYLVAKAFTTHAGRVEDVITRKKRTTPPVEPKVTGDVEARVIALACSQPPAGRQRWTLTVTEQSLLPTLGTGQGLWRIKHRSFVCQHQLHPAEFALFDTTARMSGT